jgi:hypothetical protein
MTVMNSVVMDTNSHITNATNSQLILNGSTVTSTNCIITAIGGNITDSGSTISATGGTINGGGSTVTSTGTSVINPEGLTVGQGFSASEQGAAVLYDGSALTIECTTGEIAIDSTTSEVNVHGLTDVNITDGP